MAINIEDLFGTKGTIAVLYSKTSPLKLGWVKKAILGRFKRAKIDDETDIVELSSARTVVFLHKDELLIDGVFDLVVEWSW